MQELKFGGVVNLKFARDFLGRVGPSGPGAEPRWGFRGWGESPTENGFNSF